MRFILSVFIAAFLSSTAVAATIRGTIRNAAGQPLADALVALDTERVTTDIAGNFAFDVADGTYTLRVTRPGFRSETRAVRAGERVELTLEPALEESIVVSGIRADATTPVTKTNIERAEIERTYYGQDIPLLLRDTPSINAYADAGVGGSGYSYFTLRGVAATRLNVTLDGVPLADSEDMGTYFADFPDLAHSLESIQIQRGVGTSSVGSPSFGGSINLESIALAAEPGISAQLAAGSFGSRLATVGYQSGLLPGGFALYSRVSYNESEGFRDRSGARQHNVFFSAAKQDDDAQIKLTGFTARESQQLAYFAVDEATLKGDLRFNPLLDEEKDSFGYDLAQLQYTRALPHEKAMTASVYYQRGYGWYRLFDDSSAKSGLREYGLDGMLLGSLLTLSSRRGPFETSYGLHVNRFERDHTRDLVGGARDYSNYGTKSEANAFARVLYDREAWHLYADAQLRWTDFQYHGDVKIDPIDWMFFNPKIGARRNLSSASSVYLSAGLSSREPARNDLFQGEDNATVSHDLRAVKPERLFDVEAGWDYRTARTSIAANVFAMEFHDEIAATGELSELGLLLRRNVDRSYRRGLELEATWQPATVLRFRTDASFSRNRIRRWTQFYDVYDATANYVTSEPMLHRDVQPALTPSVLIDQSIEYTRSPRLGASITARYASESHLDNTNSDRFVTPAFTTLDATVSFGLLRLQINNLLDNRRVFPSGYSYQFLSRDDRGGETLDGIRYFYPQATRNVTVMVDFRH